MIPASNTPKTAPVEQNFTPGSVRRLEAIKEAAPSLFCLFKRATEERCSPRQAIKAQCLDCQGLDRGGVRTYGDHCCRLWHVRPFQQLNAQSTLKNVARSSEQDAPKSSLPTKIFTPPLGEGELETKTESRRLAAQKKGK